MNYIKVDKQDIQTLKNLLGGKIKHNIILNYVNEYISPEPFVKKMNKITARCGTIQEISESVCCNAKVKWTPGLPDFPGDKVGITQSAFCTNCLRPCDIKK